MRRAIVLGALIACGNSGNGSDGGMNGDSMNGMDGSMNGDTYVPPPPPTCMPPEMASDTSNPTTVVGSGAGTCNETLLAAALAKAGVITFNCGPSATIMVSKTLDVRTDADTVIDGGGQVTLDGGGKVGVLSFNHPDYRKNDKKLTLQHLTIANGKVSGTKPYAAAPAPCSQGFYDGYGGGLFVRDGVLLVIDVTFASNAAEKIGPDVGGGAISIQGVKKATIIGSIFKNNTGSNGGGIESLNSDFDVYNCTFDSNSALGNGANSDDAGKCAVVADNGQHQVGSGGNGGAVAIDGGSDLTHTFCGVTFRNNQSGMGALGGAMGRTPDNAKQTTVINRCLFDGNTALGSAGAAYFHNSTLQIHETTFHANSALGSATIQADGTTLDFVNDTFAGNKTTSTGAVSGAISLFGGDGKIQNCTFADNTVDGFGAAIFGNPTLSIQNTLFSNNIGQNPGAPMQCQITASPGTGDFQFPQNHKVGGSPDAPCATGITFADPKLGMYGDNGGPTPTMVPQAGSPAIGAGMNCPATDQRGQMRKANGCTSGAVELP